jgi:hypothetical protein
VIAGSGARIRPPASGRAFPRVPTLASGLDYSQGACASFRAGSFPRQLQAPTLASGHDSPQGSSDGSAVPGCNAGDRASLEGFSHNRQSHVLSLLIGSSFEPFRPIRACSDLFGPIRTYSDLITRFDGSHGEPIVSVLCLFVLICAYLFVLIRLLNGSPHVPIKAISGPLSILIAQVVSQAA